MLQRLQKIFGLRGTWFPFWRVFEFAAERKLNVADLFAALHFQRNRFACLRQQVPNLPERKFGGNLAIDFQKLIANLQFVFVSR